MKYSDRAEIIKRALLEAQNYRVVPTQTGGYGVFSKKTNKFLGRKQNHNQLGYPEFASYEDAMGYVAESIEWIYDHNQDLVNK